jgi:hypothetical protein
MPDQRSRSRIQARDVVAVALGFILAFITFVAVYGLHGAGSRAAKPHPRVQDEQVLLQSSIINDREHLFNGVLTFPLPSPMPVEPACRDNT